MPTRALGVDLASARWRDNGTAVVAHDGETWTTCTSPAIAWRGTGRPTAEALAAQIDEFARTHGIDVISIDGPQGWRDPQRDPAEGVGRRCEREARAPGKTGEVGRTYPANYVGWTTLSIELFARLRDLGHRVVECFPTSAWRSLALPPLPAKSKRPDVGEWSGLLRSRVGIDVPPGLSHDDLQAVVAAIVGASLDGGPLLPVARGIEAFEATA